MDGRAMFVVAGVRGWNDSSIRGFSRERASTGGEGKKEVGKDPARKTPYCYRRKVSVAEPLAWQFSGANLGPISVPQCSKCSESARKRPVSR